MQTKELPQNDSSTPLRKRAPLKPRPAPTFHYPTQLEYSDRMSILHSPPPMFQILFSTGDYGTLEAWAKEVLQDAGLAIPGDESPLDFIKARGYREGVDIEWYAVEILNLIWSLQAHSYGQRVYYGSPLPKNPIAKLDRLVRKAEILNDPVSRSARIGGRVRGAQRATERTQVESALRDAAARLKRGLSKRDKAALWKRKKEFSHLSVETIRKRI